MTETIDQNPADQNPAEQAPASAAPRARRSRKSLFAAVAAAVVLATAALGITAYAKGPGGDRHGGRMGGFMIERMLDRVDATAEQRTKIGAIVEKTKADLQGLQDERKAMMDDVMTLLKSPTVDRGAIETKRLERVAKFEAASKQMSAAFGDIAEVLTPEQRKIVAALIADRMDHNGRDGKGRHGKMEQDNGGDGAQDAQPAPKAN
jgi:periplasmic protein CpxP/Spy